MKSAIDIFIELKNRISGNLPLDILHNAVRENSWFSTIEIRNAIDAICRTMLTRKALEEWMLNYPELPSKEPKSTLIVMAGNIPLVGFFDLLCVIMAGDRAIVKPSHKDRVLMEWIIGEMQFIEPMIPIYICYDDSVTPDRVIATGGESAVRYFRERYNSTPTLLRGSRHSVAIIRSEDEMLDGLERDIYLYSGLGCRNVSMIFAPEGYDITLIPQSTINQKYNNNYLQNRALLKLNEVDFTDSGISCLVESYELPSQISTISIARYTDIDEVEGWVEEHDHKIQCIVANKETIDHPRRVNFGAAQYPTLNDYADGIDTMKFLL
ncbi:MAG: acyl-CoA reductase [Rikenellaceae bacterium]